MLPATPDHGSPKQPIRTVSEEPGGQERKRRTQEPRDSTQKNGLVK